MSLRKSKNYRRVEAEHGDVGALITRYRDDGYSLGDIAERHGLARQTAHNWARHHGVTFPKFGWRARQKIALKQSRYKASHGRASAYLFQIARKHNLPWRLVYSRYQNGKRGRELWRPYYGRGAQRDYELGLSMSEWEIVLDYADSHSVGGTSVKFQVPVGAIRAMQRGQLERVA